MPTILLLDNHDSFTYNLVDYVEQLGAKCLVYRNDEISVKQVLKLAFDGILLSPGPGIPSHSGIMMALLKEWHTRLPILGVCLGHQAIGQFFGASLQKADYPMHGKTSEIICKKHEMFADIPTKHKVMRYHSLVLQEVPAKIKVTAITAQKEIMAIAHKNLPIWGVQYHPESILSEYGKELINNWLKIL